MKKKYIIIALISLIAFFIVHYLVYLYRNNGSVELEFVNKMEYHNDSIDFRPTRVISRKIDFYDFLYELSRCYYPDSSGKDIYTLARERAEADMTSNNADLFHLLQEASFPDSLARVFIHSFDLQNHDYIVAFNKIQKCNYSIEHTEQEWIPKDDRIPLEPIILPGTEDTLYIYRVKAEKGKFR
ncbi:MAG: hypothetical protein IKX36_01450 [Prevotella sp.]|nr:hypothetical protein [Prevotella sp.]